jgi:hypothetical protein
MSRYWKRGLIAWLVMAVAMTVNCIIRETAFKKAVGDRAAGVMSAASGIAVIQLIARQAFRPVRPLRRNDVTLLATAWLLMTLAFEFAVGRSVDRKSWRELLTNYDVRRGNLWPFVLATVVAAPFLWTSRE